MSMKRLVRDHESEIVNAYTLFPGEHLPWIRFLDGIQESHIGLRESICTGHDQHKLSLAFY